TRAAAPAATALDAAKYRTQPDLRDQARQSQSRPVPSQTSPPAPPALRQTIRSACSVPPAPAAAAADPDVPALRRSPVAPPTSRCARRERRPSPPAASWFRDSPAL